MRRIYALSIHAQYVVFLFMYQSKLDCFSYTWFSYFEQHPPTSSDKKLGNSLLKSSTMIFLYLEAFFKKKLAISGKVENICLLVGILFHSFSLLTSWATTSTSCNASSVISPRVVVLLSSPMPRISLMSLAQSSNLSSTSMFPREQIPSPNGQLNASTVRIWPVTTPCPPHMKLSIRCLCSSTIHPRKFPWWIIWTRNVSLSCLFKIPISCTTGPRFLPGKLAGQTVNY